MSTRSSTAPVIHLCSDIHFGKEDPRIIAAFEADLDATATGPRMVVIPGDLVQTGTKKEFSGALAFLRSLHDRGIPVVLTPGNHDLGRAAHEFLPKPFSPGKVRRRFWKLWRVHLELSRRTGLVATDDLDAIHRVGDHVFVALRSVHRGRWGHSSKRISSDQIDWARKMLRKHGLQKHTLHLVTHRSLWDGKHSAMRQRERLGKKLLAREGFSTLIHGHNHSADWTADRRLPKVRATIDHLSVPSLTARRPGDAGWARWTPGRAPEQVLWS